MSDLHGNLPTLPESDLLLIGGDISPLNIQSNNDKMKKWLEDEFKQWCKDQETYQIVLIAGNHDFIFKREPEAAREIFNNYGSWFHYLENETKEIEVEGIKLTIFGTPYCHRYGYWAFMEDDYVLDELFKECPDHVDIILSHDAPYGVTDICLEKLAYTSEGSIGSRPLRDRINKVVFKYLFHGHLHSSDHKLTPYGSGLVCNTSLLNEKYKLFYEPTMIDYEP